MAEINLLPIEERAAESFKLLQKRLTLASTVLLVIVAVFTLGTLVFFSKLAGDRDVLNGQIAASSATIDSLKGLEELIVVIKKKAAASEKIFTARAEYSSVFSTLSELTPQGVYFTDLKVSGGKIIFSGRARTSAEVAGLVSSLVSAKGTQIVSNVIVDSLSSDDKGVYSFVISSMLIIKEGGNGS